MNIAEQRLLVGGRWLPSESGNTYESLDLFTGRPATQAAAATIVDVDRAVAATQAAFGPWAALPPSRWRELLVATAEAVESRSADPGKAITAEMGGPAAWGRYNLKVLADKLRVAAGAAYQGLTGEVIPSDHLSRSMIAIRKPAGVVFCLVPWNAPALLVGASVPAALVVGNTVVIKASVQTPRTHGLVAECFNDADLPAGVVNLVTNAPQDAGDVVEALIVHPAVRRIHFTGSTRVGGIIAERAGRHLKRAVLELGGKAPCIVLAEADLDRAAQAAAFGSFAKSGQGCLSTKRIIVDWSIADDFCARLATAAKTMVHGDPRKTETVIGPVVNRAALQFCPDWSKTRSRAARAGGAADGPCFPLTVLSGVTPAMRVYKEESFVPLASVVIVEGPEEALQVANDNAYGPSSAIFSRDVTLALELAKRLDVGMAHINGQTLDDEAQIPFGDTKDSGYGRSGGLTGIEELTELQWITIEGTSRK